MYVFLGYQLPDSSLSAPLQKKHTRTLFHIAAVAIVNYLHWGVFESIVVVQLLPRWRFHYLVLRPQLENLNIFQKE